MLARWGKDEMGIGMPGHLFTQVVRGVLATVNPLERVPEKREISQRLERAGRHSELDIQYGRNYDDHCYVGGPAGLPSSEFGTA